MNGVIWVNLKFKCTKLLVVLINSRFQIFINTLQRRFSGIFPLSPSFFAGKPTLLVDQIRVYIHVFFPDWSLIRLNMSTMKVCVLFCVKAKCFTLPVNKMNKFNMVLEQGWAWSGSKIAQKCHAQQIAHAPNAKQIDFGAWVRL